jgi:hypothetical protein
MPTAAPVSVRITDVEHLKVDYARDRYSGHPRQGGIFNFGNGEIAILYHRAPCAYHSRTDVLHDFGGYHSHSQVIMARSYDFGQTWDRTDDVVVFDETKPVEERRAFVRQVDTTMPIAPDAIDLSAPVVPRERIDLTSPDTAICFGRTYAGTGDPPALVCFALRSADRGRTWETVPTPILPPSGHAVVHKDGHPLVQMPDGTQLAAMTVGNPSAGIVLYGTDDNGLNWDPIARVHNDPTSAGRSTYAGLLLLPGGQLQCYMLNLNGQRDCLQMNYSEDGGYSWSTPRPIVRWGQSPWAAAARAPARVPRWVPGKFYRSPWPMRLHDGRIVVLFARRKPPYGIGLIASEDNGTTWSREAILRDDASTPDIGYPVATETTPGRIFTAYYYTLDDGNNLGGTRFIAGTTFCLA